MIGFKGDTTDKDLGAEEILRQVKRMNGAVVETGLFEGDRHPESELSLAQIGAVHEFGSAKAKIPARPWLSLAVRVHGSTWARRQQAVIDAVLSRRTNVFRALTAFGEYVASDVRATINLVNRPPKAAATLRREGARFTKVLVWFGYMRASVRSRIQLRGGEHAETKKGRISSQ